VGIDLDYMNLLSVLRLEDDLYKSATRRIAVQAITDLSQNVIDIDGMLMLSLRHGENRQW
jgi:hypothetical protein